MWKQSEPLLPVKRQVMARLCQLLDQPPPKYGNNSTTHRSIKMRCQAMKINFWNNFYQDIWRRLPFSARKIYRESFSLVKLELLSTRTRIRIKLPRSQITRLSPKNGTQVLVLHALSNIWSGQPKNRLKLWVCEARISRRLLHTSLLILRMWLCSSGQDSTS